MAKLKGTTIPNWTMFGASVVVIQIFEEQLEGFVSYKSCLFIVLDDGEFCEDFENTKNITIFASIQSKDHVECISNTIKCVYNLFDNISSDVCVYGLDKSIINQYDINKDFNFSDLFRENPKKKSELSITETHSYRINR